MFAALNLDANDASILSLLIVMTWAVISFFCGRYGREKGCLLYTSPAGLRLFPGRVRFDKQPRQQ